MPEAKRRIPTSHSFKPAYVDRVPSLLHLTRKHAIMRSSLLASTLCVLMTLFMGSTAHGQSYPTQPVTIIAPFPPGGSVDITSRIIAEPLAKALGGNVVVENRSGASGNIGMEQAARAKPDGYTIVLNTTPIATNTTFFPKLTYDIQKNFTPVAMVGRLPHVLVVPASVQANTLAELLAMIRARPGSSRKPAGCGSTCRWSGSSCSRHSATMS